MGPMRANNQVRSLVLTPTRELAAQVGRKSGAGPVREQKPLHHFAITIPHPIPCRAECQDQPADADGCAAGADVLVAPPAGSMICTSRTRSASNRLEILGAR